MNLGKLAGSYFVGEIQQQEFWAVSQEDFYGVELGVSAIQRSR